MRTTSIAYRLGLLTLTLASVSGCCARWQQIPDDCADSLYEYKFARVVHNLCTAGEPFPHACTVDCCDLVENEYVDDECVECEVEEGCKPAPTRKVIGAIRCALDIKSRVVVGPPAVPYRPPMPPKFLAVPTSPVNHNAPSPTHSTIEVGFGPQLAFPGRN